MEIPRLNLDIKSPRTSSISYTERITMRNDRRKHSETYLERGLRIPTNEPIFKDETHDGKRKNQFKNKSRLTERESYENSLPQNFANSVTDFFQKSKEIQLELDKLNEICKNEPRIHSKNNIKGDVEIRNSHLDIRDKINLILTRKGLRKISDENIEKIIEKLLDIIEDQHKSKSKIILNQQGRLNSFGSQL